MPRPQLGELESKKGALSRTRVVEVGVAIADAEGFQAVTLSRIARELGCHVTSLRNHVESVTALHRDIALFGMLALSDALWEAALGKTKESAVRSIALAYRHYGENNPGYSHAIRAYRPGDDAEFLAARERSIAPVRATFRSFGLDEEAIGLAHRAFSSSISGFTANEALGLYCGADADDVFEQILRLFIVALEETQWLRPAAPQNGTAKRS